MTKTKVLYVEDEPFLGRIVKESLETRNFDVTMIADGRDAFKAFRATAPDICILDIMLPTKDGFSIAKEIRQVDVSVPIIFVTAKTQTDDLLQGFESGGNDYIRKPFSMEELIVRIQNLLSLAKRGNGTLKARHVLGGYEFYPQQYELKYADESRKLSHRESTLLEMLVQQPNAPVLRKNILLKLWGDDSFFNSRNLDVYITKLRDYLKKDGRIEIVTIKGVGYNFMIKEKTSSE
jgi:DNA-binding response OmpR family regulator